MTKIQNEITAPMPLLDSSGRITEEGWARHPHWRYDRDAIRASRLRIKEWDYYYILSDDLKRGITFTFSDLGYAGLIAMCWLDFEKGRAWQVDTIAPLTLGSLFSGRRGEAAPGPDEGFLFFADSKLSLEFDFSSGVRKIRFRSPVPDIGEGGRGLAGEFVLDQPKGTESMNIATSWERNRRRFYYNRKINCMPAVGKVMVGSREYDFLPESSFAGLDWGRGAWTYVNRWFWSSAGGIADGRSFGFNLGYGFSDRSPASENIVFADGIGHKLGEVVFDFNPDDYMAPWKFSDDEGRLELDFRPVVDRYGAFNLLAVKSVQHQVFGRFSGRIILDDGSEVKLQDFLGFAEDVYNRW